ncbi:MAG TPA: DUF817 domain-containing protein [Holophagaceae bacterium]|nr:DUF817 domain-containing protein [Holophagaceae bacterium]
MPWLHEFLTFGFKEARACVFAGGFFVILVLSRLVHVPGLPRYDFILLCTLALQALLLLLKVETWDEVKTLSLFHVAGLLLELFKTHPSIHSWAYPEAAFTKLWGVPLYSGFMYAAVASYMMQAWRIFDLELVAMPPARWSLGLALAIYLNFFTHHFLWDLRWPLSAAVVALFWRARVRFTVVTARRWLPLALSFVLIGFFVWVAENIATRGGAWAYPDQRMGWRPVSFGKVHSWTLLVILSFVIVADLKAYKTEHAQTGSVH